MEKTAKMAHPVAAGPQDPHEMVRSALRGMAEHMMDLANRIGMGGDDLKKDEKELCVMALVPVLEEAQYDQMVGFKSGDLEKMDMATDQIKYIMNLCYGPK